MDKVDKKKIALDAEAITEWLGRDTGHEEAGYDAEGDIEEPEEQEPKLGLPQPKHEELRKFFDGLNIEQQLTKKRRENAMEDVDMAEELSKAVGPVTPKPMGGGY